MSNLLSFSLDEIEGEIAKIIRQFTIFQCAECAEAIKKLLKAIAIIESVRYTQSILHYPP